MLTYIRRRCVGGFAFSLFSFVTHFLWREGDLYIKTAATSSTSEAAVIKVVLSGVRAT